LTSVIATSASFTLNNHVGEPWPIDTNHEFGLTLAATQSRRINGITLKSDCAVGGRINEAPFGIALDDGQKNSTFHTPFPKERTTAESTRTLQVNSATSI
jgi:hypothetical protein